VLEVQDTVKYVMDSIRSCFDGDAEVFLIDGEAGVGVDGAGVSPFVVGGDDGDKTDESGAMMSSGESRTAESTSMSTMLCSSGLTSAGFHSSSSTSFAESDNRAWWKVCRKTLA
jgi:hypothetical protein